MTAYVISDVRVHDAEGFAEYAARVPKLLARYGVEYVVRGGSPSPLEGTWETSRVIVLRFRDREHVRRWYESEDYQALAALRAGSAEVAAIVVDGYGDDTPEAHE